VASVGVSLSFVRLLMSCLWRLHCVTIFWSLLVSDEGWVLYAMVKINKNLIWRISYTHM
jgi:hypothetical protein